MDKDLYSILGVSSSASDSDIKEAYRNLAKKYHPDKNKGNAKAEERFKEISGAYEILKDPKKRKKYDYMRNNPYAGFGQTGGNDPYGGDYSDINDILSEIFGQFGGFGKRSKGAFSGFGNGATFDFSNIHSQPQKNNIQQIVQLPLSSLMYGTTIEISTPIGKRVKINIKPGTHDGNKIKLTGQAPHGDLILEIKSKNDSTFYYDGENLIKKENITLFEAVLGTKMKLTVPGNKTVNLKVPPGSSGGKRFKIPGHGFDKRGNRSDLYIELNVVIPTDLTAEQTDLIAEAANLKS